MILLIDIFCIEYGLGEHILKSKDNITTIIICRVCKLFNKIVKSETLLIHNKHTKHILLKNIEEILINKMYFIMNNNNKVSFLYESIEKYEEKISELSNQINSKIYEDIILDLKCIYQEYIFERNIANRYYEIYIYKIMENEYLKLINLLENEKYKKFVKLCII